MSESASNTVTENKENSSGTMLRSILNGINDVIVVLGSDLHSENPITSLRVKRAVKRHNAKVILLNPLPTPLEA